MGLIGTMLGVTIFMLLFMLALVGLVVIIVVFWTWMLIDCLQRKKFDDKLVWILVLIFLNLFGAFLYYILVKRKKKK